MLVLLLSFSLLFDSFLCANIFESFQKSQLRTCSGSKPISLEQIPEGNEEAESRPGSTSPIPIEFTNDCGHGKDIIEACDEFFFATSSGSGLEIFIMQPESSHSEDLLKSRCTSTTKESLSMSSMSSTSLRLHTLSICDQSIEPEEAAAAIDNDEDSIWGETVVSEVNSEADPYEDPFQDVHWNKIDMEWVQEHLIPHFKQGGHLSAFFAEHVNQLFLLNPI